VVDVWYGLLREAKRYPLAISWGDELPYMAGQLKEAGPSRPPLCEDELPVWLVGSKKLGCLIPFFLVRAVAPPLPSRPHH
jgi:hypothetical protein